MITFLAIVGGLVIYVVLAILVGTWLRHVLEPYQ